MLVLVNSAGMIHGLFHYQNLWRMIDWQIVPFVVRWQIHIVVQPMEGGEVDQECRGGASSSLHVS